MTRAEQRAQRARRAIGMMVELSAGSTLAGIGRAHGISAERVRQLVAVVAGPSRVQSHFDWNAIAVAQLRWLWAQGHSAAEIGRRLGCGKDAVIGKVHRLHLAPRPSPIRRRKA